VDFGAKFKDCSFNADFEIIIPQGLAAIAAECAVNE
jgi:hypothetical protein